MAEDADSANQLGAIANETFTVTPSSTSVNKIFYEYTIYNCKIMVSFNFV